MKIFFRFAIHHPIATAKGFVLSFRELYTHYRNPDRVTLSPEENERKLKEALANLEKRI